MVLEFWAGRSASLPTALLPRKEWASGKSAGKHRSETSEETWDFRDLGLQGACGDCFLRGHIALQEVAAVLVQVGSVCVQQAVGEWPQRTCGTLEFQDSLV